MTRAIRGDVGKAIVATVLVLAALEAAIRVTYAVRNSLVDYVPLPYLLTADYGPTPPWLVERSLIAMDSVLVWRGQPSVQHTYVDVFTSIESEDELRSLRHDFLPRLPSSLSDNEVWTVSTNSEGFRDAEFPTSKPPGSFRILTLGDSWTFGSNVTAEAAYPRQLEALLREEFPGAKFEALNLGVLGYASYNGLKLLETRGLDLDPDAVVIAFAMNEGSMAGYEEGLREAEAGDAQSGPAPGGIVRSLGGTAAAVVGHVEILQLLRYWALSLRWKQRSIGDDLAGLRRRGMWYDPSAQPVDTDEARKQWWEDLHETYERYHRRMIDMVRSQGAVPILLHNEFREESPFLEVLKELSAEMDVPLVDASVLLMRARREIQLELEQALELSPPAAVGESSPDEVTVVFRVYFPDRQSERGVFIVGPHPELGDLTPNKIAMFDDGTHGDQRAGDNVWSYSAAFERGTRVYYLYTNGRQEGVWKGLDVPAVRNVSVDSTENRPVVHGPIDTFGKMYLHADFWHTNAAGHRTIAEELIGVLRQEPQVQDYLQGVSQ